MSAMLGNRFPLPYVGVQSNISLSTDVRGIPALTIGPNNQVFFAAAMKGTYNQSGFPFTPTPSNITTRTPDGTQFLYNIVVGNYTAEGTNQNVANSFGSNAYYSFFNSANVNDTTKLFSDGTFWPYIGYQLQGTTDDSAPSIAVGPDLEMYIAYVTTSQIPQRNNMSNVPSFCGCSNQGSSDIVVARLTNQGRTADGPATTSRGDAVVTTADWRIQDATFNSCADETGPKLAIDRTNQFLYMVHQTNYQILCYTVTGQDPNIVLSCIDLETGVVVWREAQTGVNGSGQTRAPAVAVDTLGGVCVAAEITGPMTGGRDLSGSTVGVDVVKFQQVSSAPGVYAGRSRSWVLSQFVSLNPTAPGRSNTQPTIACDPVTGTILLAFVTTGELPGQTRSVGPGQQDLVVVTMKADGSNIRVQQGGVFNPDSRPYMTASTPYAAADPYGNFYLSVNIVELTAPNVNNVLLFKILKNGNTTWSYANGAMMADAYALAGGMPSTDAPNSVFPGEVNHVSTFVSTFASAVYSQTPIAAGNGYFCTATVTNNAQDVTPTESGYPGSNGLAVSYFKEALYYLNESAFNYITMNKSICACGAGECSC